MKDAFGKTIEVGQTGIHFYPLGGRALALKIRVVGFTPKRVRYEAVDQPGTIRTAIPEQFAILSAESLGIAA